LLLKFVNAVDSATAVHYKSCQTCNAWCCRIHSIWMPIAWRRRESEMSWMSKLNTSMCYQCHYYFFYTFICYIY